MKFLSAVLENDEDIYVLVDTCTYSNLINGVWKKKEYETFKNILKLDKKPMISDLSFIELMAGCKNIDEYQSFLEKFYNCEFSIISELPEFINLLSNTDFTNMSNSTFLEIKSNFLQIKNDFLKKIFLVIVKKFCILYFKIMEVTDQNYWKGIVVIFNKYLDDDFINDEIIKIYELILKRKEKVSKNILFDIANYIADLFLQGINKGYKENDIYDYVDKNNVWNNLRKRTTNFIEKVKLIDKKINVFKIKDHNHQVFLMKYLKNNKHDNYLKDEMINDSVNYAVVMSGFCTGKFAMNDLVDLYNVSLIGSNKNIKYFTNEKKWNNFLEVERNINDRLISKEDKVEKLFKLAQ